MRLFRLILIFSMVSPSLAQSEYLTLEDGTKLYVEEEGQGQAMVFIPGWTMTHRFFEKQREHFSQHYRVITYDPRGQGRSDKTDHGNSYADHAKDLHQLLQAKNLEDIVLVGWSSGCLTIYEYIESYGLDRINKLVFIDEPPKWVGNTQSEWVYGTFEDYRSSLKDLTSQDSDPEGIIHWMLADPVDSETRKWMSEEIRMTPPLIALSLYVDGLIADYTDVLSGLPDDVPLLFMIRPSPYEQARSWLELNASHARLESITSHAMFWERPGQFNSLLSNFLSGSKDHNTVKN